MVHTELKLDRDALARTLAGARLFRGLDPEYVRTLVPHAAVHRLVRGQQFWQKGVTAEHFHVVLRGVLELQRSVKGAESTLVALFGPGESPAIPVTLERRPYIADSFAATPVLEVLRVRAQPILDALPNDPKLANAMNRALLDHCRLIHSKVDVLAIGTVPRRLAAFLLDIAERFGDELEDGAHQVPLQLSRQQLASYVCARVETTIRVMSAWQKQGLVLTTRDGFVIPSLPALVELMDLQEVDGSSPSTPPPR
ncbi:MAG: Crp/Fnr family transcriptional regulator [Sandaracinaceae bacterium]|nr:Crp/Fnr family transcriptional regulator [Sandaracinaceae bacterium]